MRLPKRRHRPLRTVSAPEKRFESATSNGNRHAQRHRSRNRRWFGRASDLVQTRVPSRSEKSPKPPAFRQKITRHRIRSRSIRLPRADGSPHAAWPPRPCLYKKRRRFASEAGCWSKKPCQNVNSCRPCAESSEASRSRMRWQRRSLPHSMSILSQDTLLKNSLRCNRYRTSLSTDVLERILRSFVEKQDAIAAPLAPAENAVRKSCRTGDGRHQWKITSVVAVNRFGLCSNGRESLWSKRSSGRNVSRFASVSCKPAVMSV